MVKIEGFSFLLASLIIFFSSTQLGLHFWPASSLVYGIRIDYLSPTLYFLDILIIFYLVVQFLRKKLRFPIIHHSLFIILLVNLLFTSNPLATLSWSLHFLLYYLFFKSLSPSTIYHLPSTISIALLLQLLLASAQVSLGHSVGGLMYYLGERTVAVGTPAVALGTFMGSVVLRAYGTFSHPNVLAGWSVICLLILTKLKSNIYLLASASVFTIFSVLLTQSRSAALSLFSLVIPFHLIQRNKTRIIYFSFLVFCFFGFLSLLTPPRSDLSLSQRLDLQGVSLKAISNYPIFGTGAQSSISTYPATFAQMNSGQRLLQPDHNSLTLFLSWFGIFGVLAILYSLRSNIIHYSLFIIPIAPLLALDHYLLTSPQGLFILLLYLRVTINHEP